MRIRNVQRGGGWYALLLLISSLLVSSPAPADDPTENALRAAARLHLDRHPRWRALLHVHPHTPSVKDPEFYVDHRAQTPDRELRSTIVALTKVPGLACRFPARALWLTTELGLPPPDFGPCTELNDFVVRAPADQIAIAFASENISQPASMMGHILLKLSGVNQNRIPVEHAISFFTDLDGINFPRLAFESLVLGRRGFYTLGPYADLKNNYLYADQRNVWEFTLALDEPTRRLVHLHLFELKNVRLSYYFHKFNCSTLVQNILGVAFPESEEDRGLWVTPIDVVRSTTRSARVLRTNLLPANKWTVRAIQHVLKPGAERQRAILAHDYPALTDQALTPEKQFLLYELASAHNSYTFERNAIDLETWRARDRDLTARMKATLPEGAIDVAGYKTPAATPPDSQINLGYRASTRTLRQDFVSLEYVPASHLLTDDNSQYTSESELKIFSPRLAWDADRRVLALDAFLIYSVASFQPSDRLVPALSGRFDLGYGPGETRRLTQSRGWTAEGSVGKTYRLLDDVDAFALLGAVYRETFAGFGLTAEVGVIVREIGHFKTIAAYTVTEPTAFDGSPVGRFDLTEAYRRGAFGVDLAARTTDFRGRTQLGFDVTLKSLF